MKKVTMLGLGVAGLMTLLLTACDDVGGVSSRTISSVKADPSLNAEGNEKPAVITSPVVHDGINFGTDYGRWTSDKECDDPRFSGLGMTSTPLLPEDIMRDASDCLSLYKAGELSYKGARVQALE